MTEEQIKEMRMRLDSQSFLLGMTHGGIAAIIGSPQEMWSQQLIELQNKLSKYTGDLYYPPSHS